MEKSKQILLISLIPAILAFAFIFNVLIPSFSKMSEVQNTRNMHKKELKELKNNVEKAKTTREVFDKVSELSAKLVDFGINVPEKQELALFLVDIDKFAQNSGVQIIGLDVKPESEMEIKNPKTEKKVQTKSKRKKKKKTALYPVKLLEIPLEIQVLGPYPNVIKFMDCLEKYERTVITNGVLVKSYEKDDKVKDPRVKIFIDSSVFRAEEQEVEEPESNNGDKDNASKKEDEN